MDLVAINATETLFVSGEIDDWAPLHERRIDAIVDMDGAIDPGIPEAPNQLLYVYWPILDEALPPLPRLEALGRLVADLVESDHRVLVHCRIGFNRSVLVIATALTHLSISGEQALNHLRELRPGALSNETFAEHVRTLPARRVGVETV